MASLYSIYNSYRIAFKLAMLKQLTQELCQNTELKSTAVQILAQAIKK